MITCILCTARKDPKFNWMADSYCRALSKINYPVELIVVDKLLWETPYEIHARREQLDRAVLGRFSYRHVAPKPTAWQGPFKKTRRDYFDLNNARNTGIALARGSYCVLFDDCYLLDEEFLLWHAKVAAQNKYTPVACAGGFVSYNTANITSGQIVTGSPHPGTDSRGSSPAYCNGGWMWGLNVGFPLEEALKIGGYDELYSGQGGSEDCDFGVRLERSGNRIVFLPQCKVFQILETHEPVCDYNSTVFGKEDVEIKSRQKERKLRDGVMHYANEFLIQELHEDRERITPRGNDFDLRALRKMALAEGCWPTSRKIETDWRDGQLLRDM
jgi:glycosyltransferase involved in cell wall biosynthesis